MADASYFGLFPTSSYSDTGGLPTVKDLLRSVSPQEIQQDSTYLRTITYIRKSWKTLKGGREAVWPPPLEVALIEGLLKYRPDVSKTSGISGRYPMRNRFISNYIYEKTGKRRTPKQVGSRIQQLRDTRGGKRILNEVAQRYQSNSQSSSEDNLLSICTSSTDQSDASESGAVIEHSPYSGNSSSSLESLLEAGDYTASASLLPPGDPEFCTPVFPSNSVELITITILPAAHHRYYGIDKIPSVLGWYPGHSQRHSPASVLTEEAKPIHLVDPTVTFTSQAAFMAESSCVVFEKGVDTPVHVETTGLSISPLQDGNFLYNTILVPGYWDRICTCPDPTQYTIAQEIIQISDDNTQPERKIISSTIYQFQFSTVHEQTPISDNVSELFSVHLGSSVAESNVALEFPPPEGTSPNLTDQWTGFPLAESFSPLADDPFADLSSPYSTSDVVSFATQTFTDEQVVFPWAQLYAPPL